MASYLIQRWSCLLGEDNSVGYGWLAIIGDAILEKEKGYLGASTVFKAELFVILTILMWVLTLKEPPDKVRLPVSHTSDSRWYNRKERLGPTDQATHRPAKIRNNEISVGIEWVRGHTGVVGNELADTLEKMGPRQQHKVAHRGF